MKEALVTGIDEVLAALDRFDDVLDARSPAEFLADRLPGAISTPVLDDDQRALIGTIHKQRSPFEARRLGAALVSRNIADIVEHQFADRSRDWRPLVYCWRGGNRSAALATVLARIGWHTTVLQGGYQAFRRHVIHDLEAWPATLRFHVVGGRTGSAKSEILHQLSALGAQVLDLEALASHRGSVLGLMPDTVQPLQKRFESLLWNDLRGLDPARPVFVESESRRVGLCHLPTSLITAMRAADGTLIEMATGLRAERLLREYHHFTENRQALFERLERLVPLHGRAVVEAWRGLARDGNWPEFVVALLDAHYDPAYDRSMGRHYAALQRAPRLVITGSDDESARPAAQALLERVG